MSNNQANGQQLLKEERYGLAVGWKNVYSIGQYVNHTHDTIYAGTVSGKPQLCQRTESTPGVPGRSSDHGPGNMGRQIPPGCTPSGVWVAQCFVEPDGRGGRFDVSDADISSSHPYSFE